jgi:UDP-N-acetylmuramate--alanine ligase
MRFSAQIKANGAPARSLDASLNLPGVHNVQNALAAIAVGLELQVREEAIARALAEFKGVDRRFQRYGEIPLQGGGSFTLVDDYGHHPAEMEATLSAVRGAFPSRRLMLAFQPHPTRARATCSRLRACALFGRCAALERGLSRGQAPIVAADGRAWPAVRVAGKVEPILSSRLATAAGSSAGAARRRVVTGRWLHRHIVVSSRERSAGNDNSERTWTWLN